MAQCDKVAFMGTSWFGGGFAECLNLYAYQCFHLPDAMADQVGSMVEPFSATARAVIRGEVGSSDNVAVIGAGPIGLMAMLAASIQGAKRVVAVELAAKRIEAAWQCGATDVINPNTEDPLLRAEDITKGEGFDVVVECAGRESSGLLAGRLTRTRGKLVVMGVFDKPAPLDLTDIVFREKTVTGSMSGYGLYDQSIAMMCDTRFRGDRLVTDCIRLDHLVDGGFYPLVRETDKHIKILVEPR
jgi:(R,R)-butanediol dehydrogenase/meso-butanediol dehydrogenase/diacetyl reductase